MVAADAERWDARYEDAGFVAPAPPDAVAGAELIDLIPTSGRALDVACGLGAQTIWMAQRGLSVIGLDASLTAIESLRSRASYIDAELGDIFDHVSFTHRIDARQHDLDGGLPDDLGEFDVIVCQRFRDPNLYPAFVERLALGGVLVVTVLSQTGATAPGPFNAPAGELRTAFDVEGCTILHHTESDGQESIVARAAFAH